MAGLGMAIAVVALVGCKDAGKDDVTRTVKTYYLAVSRGDRRTACHQLARDFRRVVESGRNLLGEVDPKRCAVIYGPARRFFNRPLGENDLDVEVSLSENRAGATVRVSERLKPITPTVGVVEQLVLQRTNGVWRILGEVR